MFKKLLLSTLCISGLLISSQAYAAMTYEKALQYQSKYPKEIFVKNEKCKDVYGEKNIERFFNMLKKSGVAHSGSYVVGGKGNSTSINLLINYGFKNIKSEPFAYIHWNAALEGNPEKGYEPKTMNIAFNDGFVKTLSLQGWEYKYLEGRGLFGATWSHDYHGKIRLNDVDLYDINSHGAIASVSIDDGAGGIRHFFYAGEKDLEEKALLTKGFAHTLKILEIDASTIEAKRIELAKEAEKLRLEELRKEVEREIKEDAEREALKKQILEEMKAKQNAN